MKKRVTAIALTAIMAVSMNSTALAGGWQKDNTGWWWQNDDGSYPLSGWQWLDGNHDGVAECYYFDGNGYCLLNADTPDGYGVNADGAWVVEGVVQTKAVQSDAIQNVSSEASSNSSAISGYYVGTTGTMDGRYYPITYGYVVTELADGSISVLNDGFDGLEPDVYTKVNATTWEIPCYDNTAHKDVIRIEGNTLVFTCDTYGMTENFVRQ